MTGHFQDIAGGVPSLEPDGDAGHKRLFIASEVRSGSTFISETIAYELNAALGYGLWELAQEPFQRLDEASVPQDALAMLAQLHVDACGFSGAKILCRQLALLRRLANESTAVDEAFFGARAHWIVVRRADRVAQAVSLAAARKSGEYHHYDDQPEPKDADVSLELYEIEAALKAVALSDVYLQLWARQLPPARTISLIYEDFLVDQVGALQTIHHLCHFPPFDGAHYVNGAKLRRAGREVKQSAAAAYTAWLLANYI